MQKFPSDVVNILEEEDPLSLNLLLNRFDVIHGGPHLAETSKGVRNIYIKEAKEGLFSIQEEPPLNSRLNTLIPNLVIAPQEMKKGAHHPHNDTLIVTTQIGFSMVSKILRDTGIVQSMSFLSMPLIGWASLKTS